MSVQEDTQNIATGKNLHQTSLILRYIRLNTCARIEVNNITEHWEPNVMDIRDCAKIY